jgi:uncharacterized phage-associated protein
MARTSSAADVGQFILSCGGGPMEQMKLQKLLYYCQAWSLVWDGTPIFHDRIEAWANGPVVPSVWAAHRYQFIIDDLGGDAALLDDDNRKCIRAVLRNYGNKSSAVLTALTHSEDPWKRARGRAASGDASSTEITAESMRVYYSQLESHSLALAGT